MELSFSAFEIIYGVGVVCGLLDITCFFWVGHPKMDVKHGEDAALIPMIKAAMHPKFLKFVAVLSILWFSSSFEALAGYHMMRGIGMEIFSMQMLGLFGTCVYVVFGILWGHFLDHYGSKATFIIGMIGAILPPFIVILAPYYGEVALYVAAAIGTIVGAALGLSATNLLCSLSKKEDQAMTNAANSVIAGIVQAAGFLTCEDVFFPVLKAIGNHFNYGPLFYAMVVYAVIGIMRIVSGIWSLRMPEVEAKPPAVIAVRMFYTTNPLRAFYSMGRFLIAKSSDLVHKKGDTDLHPSARWRLG
jgi:MFS family permease